MKAFLLLSFYLSFAGISNLIWAGLWEEGSWKREIEMKARREVIGSFNVVGPRESAQTRLASSTPSRVD